jgi:hypothetical protein
MDMVEIEYFLDCGLREATCNSVFFSIPCPANPFQLFYNTHKIKPSPFRNLKRVLLRLVKKNLFKLITNAIRRLLLYIIEVYTCLAVCDILMELRIDTSSHPFDVTCLHNIYRMRTQQE